jgi:toxin CptA
LSFETTVDVSLRPSLRLLKWLSTLHVLPLALIPFAMSPGLPMALLIGALALSWFTLRRHAAFGFGRRALRRLVWNADGRWTVYELADRPLTAELAAGGLRHPQLLLLRFRLDGGGHRTRLIGGDEADPELLRRLRARLSTAD